MAAETIIEVEQLAKGYRIGRRSDQYGSLRDSIANTATRFVHRQPREARGAAIDQWLWALEDVSFEIGTGEIVGVIGRNGAGKSTLLKILSRITEPTRGRARLWGRVGSLLEVGTGFHAELTGRENVYLNGAILGMRKSEIDVRFDEIVEFAEISRFLDTPVKRYSSGMIVRLAFAVAAHLEPEILLIDEVLAVGDTAFQKKCVGKIGDVANSGRTVLFVSHNMAVMEALCRRAIILQHGRVLADEPIGAAVSRYLLMLDQAATTDLAQRTDRRGWQQVQLEQIEITGESGVDGMLAVGRPARFQFTFGGRDARVSCAFTIFNQLGHALATFDSDVFGPEDVHEPGLQKRFVCEVPESPLAPGRYRIDAKLQGSFDIQDMVEGAAFFDVEQGVLGGRPVEGTVGNGDLAVIHRWLTPE